MAQSVATLQEEINSRLVFNDRALSSAMMIDIGRVLPNPLNPRGEIEDDSDLRELSNSIRTHGVLQPLLVTPVRDGYYAVAGHRRRRAALLAGLTELPCVVRELDEDAQLDVMMIENIQRQNLTAIQEARAFQRMIQNGRTVTDVMQRLALSRGYVEARLTILSLPESVQKLFERNLLPIGAAQVLSLASDVEQQKRFATVAVQTQMPMGKLEQLIRGASDRPKKESRPGKTRYRTKRVLDAYEMFTRSEALHELEREGSVTFEHIAAAFNDICDGLCTEDDAGREMCEACPVPRFIASLLRRSGAEVRGRNVGCY